MLKNEKKIIERLKNKEEEAFNILYKWYFRYIFYIIFKIVDNKEVANDLTNDTFVTMYQKIDTHDESKNFKYWLVAIAKNNALQYLRKKKKDFVLDNETAENVTDPNSSFEKMMEQCSLVLTREEFDIVNRHIVFKEGFVEIAVDLEMSKSTVHRIYKNAIQKLRKELR